MSKPKLLSGQRGLCLFWKLWEDVEEINSRAHFTAEDRERSRTWWLCWRNAGKTTLFTALLFLEEGKKKNPCPATQCGSTHLIEPSIQRLSSGSGLPKNGCDAQVQNSGLIDFCQDKSVECCASIPSAFGNWVRLAVRSLNETLASKPPLFSCCKTSQESQVVMKHVLIDNVLSPHHFAFKARHNEEKHVRATERNLGAKRSRTSRDCK